MAGINKVILIGNCGKDPELRHSSSDIAITTVNIATTESWRDRESGEWKEQTEWHRVVLFRERAERAAKSLHKGARVYVEGKLRTRDYEKDGVKRYTTEIVADRILNLSGRSDQPPRSEGGGETADRQEQAMPAPTTGTDAASTEDFDDEIPF